MGLRAIVVRCPNCNANPYQLAAFDLETGKRLWEHPFHPKIRLPVFTPVRLVAAGDVVMLTTWSSLNAFELADGTERFQIGG